jgi:WhiB family redox-sensing transcriptional regulator
LGESLDPLDVHVALVELLDRRPAWQRDAACREHSLEWFFPEKNARPEDVAAARAVCAGCLVREECATYAAGLPGPLHGIWSGATGYDRRIARRRAA